MSEWTPVSTLPKKPGAYLLRCASLDDPNQAWLSLAMRISGRWIEMYQGGLKSVLDDRVVCYWQPAPKSPTLEILETSEPVELGQRLAAEAMRAYRELVEAACKGA